VLLDDPNPVVDDLQESPLHAEPLTSPGAESKLPLAEEGHHRRVTGEYADLAVVRRRDDRVRRPFEQDGFRRDDRDGEHDQPCSFFAFSTTSSMLPAMKNTCSGR
jgi:hypothetical protein